MPSMTVRNESSNQTSLKLLQCIPGVGKSIALDLCDLGYMSPSDLKGEDPETMYHKLIALRGAHQDRCLLYVFRCTVYFASHRRHDTDKLKWWSWKDQ